MSKKFDGIILDIDGTIWNTTGIISVAWNRAIDISGLNARKVNAQMLQAEFGKTMEVIAQDLWPELTEKERSVLMSYCCTEEQIALKENTLDITYPGVVETIRELSCTENFFIVSNCHNGYIEILLEKTGLTPFIKDYECYGRTGKGKAENIQILMARNQLTEPLYIGDTQTDCDACLQAEVSFAWAAYGFGTASAYREKLEKFSDLKNIIVDEESED